MTSMTEAYFVPLFAPFLRRASRRLAHRLEELNGRRVTSLYDARAIHVQLLEPLAALAQSMALELDIARLADALPAVDPRRRPGPDVPPELMGCDPVLARRFTIAVRRWSETTSELVERIDDDWDLIQDRFGLPGPPAGIRLRLGDRHRDTTAEVAWAGGQHVVYRPRSMAVDVHFSELLSWLNARGLSIPLRSADVLDRGEYGWMRVPCGAPDPARRFYYRQGCLLALLFLLHAGDVPAGSLVAAGEHPILVDAESLIQPGLPRRDPARTPAEEAATEAFENSVLATGLLHRPDARRPEYAGEVVAGFTEMYRLCERHRHALADGPLTAFAGDEVRVIRRGDDALFTIVAGGHVLRDGNGRPVAGVVVESGLDRVRRRLAGLTEVDLARQTWLIRAAIG